MRVANARDSAQEIASAAGHGQTSRGQHPPFVRPLSAQCLGDVVRGVCNPEWHLVLRKPFQDLRVCHKRPGVIQPKHLATLEDAISQSSEEIRQEPSDGQLYSLRGIALAFQGAIAGS